MKVPFPANNQIINSSYEPKSVLDLRGSPRSPVNSDQKPANSKTNTTVAADRILAVDPVQLDDHHVLISPQLDDDFDSLMRDWGLHDDSTKPFSQLINSDHHQSDHHVQTTHDHQYSSDNLPEFPIVTSFDFDLPSDIPIHTTNPPININPNFENFPVDVSNTNWNTGFDFVDELIRLAECFETNSPQLGHAILARLNQRLRSPAGKPLQRAAFYFKEALQTLLTGPARPASTAFEIVQTIKAQKTFSNVSPITMFAGFTANQAVLEALVDGTTSNSIHVIDFDIGLGGHWASFMKELADRAGSSRVGLRISALVSDEYGAESKLIRENLSLFARELNIRFEIEFVSTRAFEYLSFKSIRLVEGERVAVVLSPAIFRHVGTGFLNELRRVGPHVVVHVDVEGGMGGFGTASSYRQAVIDGLEFYSTVMESLEASNLDGGDWVRRIETFVLYPRIVEGVAGVGRRGAGWGEVMAAAGMRQVGLSQFAEFQAECLVRRVQVRGFHVAKRQGEMMLCWHDRPLVATSAWRI